MIVSGYFFRPCSRRSTHMKPRLAAATLVAVLFASIVGTLRADITAEQVRNAIDQGVKFLKSQQHANGSWIDLRSAARRNHGSLHVGPTELRRGAERRAHPKGAPLASQGRARTYLRGFAANDGLRPGRAGKGSDADPPQRAVAGETRKSARAKWYNGGLELIPAARATTPTPSSRCWRCTRRNSSACRPATKPGNWPRTIGRSVRIRSTDRGATTGQRTGTGSMTCAGITSLVIATDRVQANDARVVGNRIECCLPRDDEGCRQHRTRPAMAWAALFRAPTTRARAAAICSTIFTGWSARGGSPPNGSFPCLPDRARPTAPTGIARAPSIWCAVRTACRASGGASARPKTIRSSARVSRCCSSRKAAGRCCWPNCNMRPGDDWNSHRNDVGNLTRYVERKWKRDMTWQVIDLRLATVEELGQAPVLYLMRQPRPGAGRACPAQGACPKAARLSSIAAGFSLPRPTATATSFNTGFRNLDEGRVSRTGI